MKGIVVSKHEVHESAVGGGKSVAKHWDARVIVKIPMSVNMCTRNARL